MKLFPRAKTFSSSTSQRKITKNHQQQQQQQKQQHLQQHQWFRHPIPPYGYGPPKPTSFSELRRSDPILFPNHHPIQTHQEPHNPSHQQHPIQYFPFPPNNTGPPKLSASIASLHNAALVYLHRGLAIHSIQANHPAPAPASSDSLALQEPFLSAVVKGFNQILQLQTGLEFSQTRQVMESLVSIVRGTLDMAAEPHRSQEEIDQVWNHSKSVIIQSALRPRMSCIGDWAWEEIKRGNFHRLIQVWTGILDVVDQKSSHPHQNTHLSTTPITIGLDQRFFTALVIVSSTIENGPKLPDLVESLVDRVWSQIEASDRLVLDGIVPDPHRARYFLRAIELGLIWRRPNNNTPQEADRDDQEEDENGADHREPKVLEQDERIVHLIRRTFLSQRPDSIQFCVDLSKRIQEAVEGSKDEPGWLSVDWSSAGSSTHANVHQLSSDQPTTNKSGRIALTQKVVSIFFNGFAENGLIPEVEELIRFSRKIGGMNQVLWTSILRGLSKLKRPELVKEYLNRMNVEDQIEIDFNIRCILISASIGTSDLTGGIDAIDQLISLSESESNAKKIGVHAKEPKLPIEAINSIISALLRNGLLERAERLMENLSGRIRPNTTTLNHFLKYHSRLNPATELNLESVLNHLKLFEEVYATKPDVISFTILLNILMKLGFSSNIVEKLLLMMASMGIQPNAITYGSIIHHLCRSGKTQDVHVALKLLNQIEENGIATTDITYTALIQGFLRAHIQEYESKTEGIQQPQHGSPIQSSGGYNQGVNNDDGKSNLEKASDLISRLKSRSGRINQVIYNALLNALFSTAEFETGFEVFKLMKSEYDVHCRQQQHPQPAQHPTRQRHPQTDDFNPTYDLSNLYYGNGFIDSYGIIFRRLIQFGQFELFKVVYYQYFKLENFPVVPVWIQKLIDRFERSGA